MKINRILSIILSVVMMVTIIFSTGVFAEGTEAPDVESAPEEIVVNTETEAAAAEDTAAQEPEEETEEPAAEEKAEDVVEASEDSEETDDSMPANETAETQTGAEEELPFEQGYVRTDKGASVYPAESRKNAIGSFDGAAVVYAVVTKSAEDEADSWLRITFDTAEAKEADEDLLDGYVQFKDVTVLSDEETEELIKDLKADDTTRSYKNNLIPTVDFKPVEADTDEETVPLSESEDDYDAAQAVALAIVTQPQNFTAKAGESLTLSVVAEGTGLTYQWQYQTTEGGNWYNSGSASAKTASWTQTLSSATVKYKFRCVITDGAGNTVTTKEVGSAYIIENSVWYEPITETSCRLIKYYGTATSLVIPETVEGMTVTEIGEEAFMDNKSLVSIDLPDTITVLCARAFKNCSNLSEMK